MTCERCGEEVCAKGFNCVSRALERAEREQKRLRDGWDKQTDYCIVLQRIIEAICHGHSLREEAFAEAPRHAEMAQARISYAGILAAALKELDEATMAPFPSFEDGITAQDAWAQRQNAARYAARAALTKNPTGRSDPAIVASSSVHREAEAGGRTRGDGEPTNVNQMNSEPQCQHYTRKCAFSPRCLPGNCKSIQAAPQRVQVNGLEVPPGHPAYEELRPPESLPARRSGPDDLTLAAWEARHELAKALDSEAGLDRRGAAHAYEMLVYALDAKVPAVGVSCLCPASVDGGKHEPDCPKVNVTGNSEAKP